MYRSSLIELIAMLAVFAAVLLLQWKLGDAAKRRIDMCTLWPACKENAPTLHDAREIFVWHMAQDSCWDPVVAHLSEDEFNTWCEEHLI